MGVLFEFGSAQWALPLITYFSFLLYHTILKLNTSACIINNFIVKVNHNYNVKIYDECGRKERKRNASKVT